MTRTRTRKTAPPRGVPTIPLAVNASVDLLPDVLTRLGWRRVDGAIYDPAGCNLGVLTVFETWAALEDRGLITWHDNGRPYTRQRSVGDGEAGARCPCVTAAGADVIPLDTRLARQRRHIAESMAARDAKRAAAASTCETPEALADHIQRSINVNDARNVLGEIADEMRADDRPIPPKGAA